MMERRKITIPVQITAWVIDGIAVHPNADRSKDDFALTHVNTGLAMAPFVPTEGIAIAVAERLAGTSAWQAIRDLRVAADVTEEMSGALRDAYRGIRRGILDDNKRTLEDQTDA